MAARALGAGCLLQGLAGALRAQQVRDLTVEECVRLGLARSARVRAAAADADAARAGYGVVRAGRLPALRGQGSYTRLSNNIPPVAFTLPGVDSTFVFQGVELNRYAAELTLEQPLFTGLRLRNEVRAAAATAEASALDEEQERADAALEIRRAYWTLHRAYALRASLDASIGLVEAHLRDIRNRVGSGAALRRDLLAAETRRAEVELQRVEAENGVRVGQLELNRVTGLPLDTRVQPVDTIVVDSMAGDAAEAELARARADALAGRPQLRALALRVGALRAQLRAAQGSRFPELSLLGRYQHSRPNPYFFMEPDRFRQTWELGLSARWGMWEGGRTGAQVAESRARLAAAEARLEDARNQVAVEVARRQLEVARSAAAVAAATRNVASAEESFRVTRQQFDEGVALSADVLDAEDALRRAQAGRAGALADHALARAALLAIAGRVE